MLSTIPFLIKTCAVNKNLGNIPKNKLSGSKGNLIENRELITKEDLNQAVCAILLIQHLIFIMEV